MRLISLNVWGGKRFEPLMDFVRQSAVETDIFCFQEVFDTQSKLIVNNDWRVNIYGELTRVLDGFRGYFFPVQDGYDDKGPVDFPLSWGNATFVRQSIKVEKTSEIFIHRERNGIDPKNLTDWPRNLASIRCSIDKRPFTVMNTHGLWCEGPKLDTPETLAQSSRIRTFLDGVSGSKILSGDFNLRPETESIKTLESGMRNLITEYGITSTRSVIFDEMFKGRSYTKFADYAFVSPEIIVKDFRVLDVAVSDHAPLVLDFFL